MQAVQLTSLITRRKWARSTPFQFLLTLPDFVLPELYQRQTQLTGLTSETGSCELETPLTAGSFLKWCIKETLCCRFKGMEIFHSKIVVWDTVSYRTLNGMWITEKKKFSKYVKRRSKIQYKEITFQSWLLESFIYM